MSCSALYQKKGMCNSYKNISKFGSNNSPNNDPLTYCLYADVDKTLSHNPLGYQYGPANRNCQIYMADYCSKDGAWSNGICQLAFSKQSQVQPQTGGVTKYSGFNPDNGNVLNGNVTEGQNLLRSAAQRRFLDLSGCPYDEYPFDPTVASSPMIRDYLVAYGKNMNGSICRGDRCSGRANLENIPPSGADRDALLNSVIDNAPICMDILKSICITMKLENKIKNYEGTRIGNFCKAYFASFN